MIPPLAMTELHITFMHDAPGAADLRPLIETAATRGLGAFTVRNEYGRILPLDQ